MPAALLMLTKPVTAARTTLVAPEPLHVQKRTVSTEEMDGTPQEQGEATEREQDGGRGFGEVTSAHLPPTRISGALDSTNVPERFLAEHRLDRARLPGNWDRFIVSCCNACDIAMQRLKKVK